MPTLREEIKAAATEIQRLVQRRLDVGPVENQDWCDHTGGGPARFRIECVECIVEIITGAARAHDNRHGG